MFHSAFGLPGRPRCAREQAPQKFYEHADAIANHYVALLERRGQFHHPESDAAQRRFAPRPFDLGAATDQVFLILFGTGLRNHRGLPGVNLRLGGVAVPAQFAGATPGDPGGDQINAALPRGLTGRGEMDVVLMVDGKTTNSVRIIIK